MQLRSGVSGQAGNAWLWQGHFSRKMSRNSRGVSALIGGFSLPSFATGETPLRTLPVVNRFSFTMLFLAYFQAKAIRILVTIVPALLELAKRNVLAGVAGQIKPFRFTGRAIRPQNRAKTVGSVLISPSTAVLSGRSFSRAAFHRLRQKWEASPSCPEEMP